jgi:hypothetical protein
MIARMLALTLLAASPALAQQATPLVCLFRPVCAQPGCDTASFTVEIAPIDHEPGLWVVSDGIQAPLRDVTPADAPMQSFISLDLAERRIISVFGSGAAIYSRHFEAPGRGPDIETAIGQCEVL